LVKIGNTVELEVIHTPGHSPGGICLKTDNIIFVGDTLFQMSIGRTDFPGGSYKQLINNIKEKLLCFPDDTVCYPATAPLQPSVSNARTTRFYKKKYHRLRDYHI
jgi:glyoxylase-like metal-dependent hydrolase (beta-lactamase superfamily II)